MDHLRKEPEFEAKLRRASITLHIPLPTLRILQHSAERLGKSESDAAQDAIEHFYTWRDNEN